MKPMSVTLDTSHFDMSPLNVFELVTGFCFESKSNQLMSVTAETCHDLVGPCGPLEQSLDSFRHSTMAAWSSAFEFGAHPSVGANGVRVGVRIMIRVRLRVKVRMSVIVPLQSDGCTCGSGRVLGVVVLQA